MMQMKCRSLWSTGCRPRRSPPGHASLNSDPSPHRTRKRAHAVRVAGGKGAGEPGRDAIDMRALGRRHAAGPRRHRDVAGGIGGGLTTSPRRTVRRADVPRRSVATHSALRCQPSIAMPTCGGPRARIRPGTAVAATWSGRETGSKATPTASRVVSATTGSVD